MTVYRSPQQESHTNPSSQIPGQIVGTRESQSGRQFSVFRPLWLSHAPTISSLASEGVCSNKLSASNGKINKQTNISRVSAAQLYSNTEWLSVSHPGILRQATRKERNPIEWGNRVLIILKHISLISFSQNAILKKCKEKRRRALYFEIGSEGLTLTFAKVVIRTDTSLPLKETCRKKNRNKDKGDEGKKPLKAYNSNKN